ncbi:MAG: 16S rRNA (cytosine(1402)-N(4))-methyltransferase RsmH [Verrucomicrobiales bacterium]|nr:16S rRNA (cytosine(1402)-N(4))-methyltransferase RsmH [Verrucomicrobiales bacterium]
MVYSLQADFSKSDQIPGGSALLCASVNERRAQFGESGRFSCQQDGEEASPRAADGNKDGVTRVAEEFYHLSVLEDEVLQLMAVTEGEVVFDGTLGGGGHSERLLAAGARVIACDRDPAALAFACERLAAYGDQFKAYHGNYDQMDQLLAGAGEEAGVDGILLDLGISSKHVDDAERGFSFAKDGPLDMRMDSTADLTAEILVNEGGEDELRRILWDFGEERSARAVVRAMVAARELGRIETTGQLAALVESVIPRRGKRHPATKVFQALRMAVNDELGHLQKALEKSVNCLKPGGRLAIISFHSLEDRIVKRFLRQHSMAMLDRPEWPEPKPNPECYFSLPVRKPYAPGASELENNPRARSAKLRIAIRLESDGGDLEKRNKNRYAK